MNVLLATAAAPRLGPFSTAEKRPPLGIGFLISTLEQGGHKVHFIDNYLSPTSFIEEGYLEKNGIDFFGIYATTICYEDVLRMLGLAQAKRKSGRWSGKLMLGGPHTTVAPETIPDYVDFVVQGEGEQAVVDIVAGDVSERLVRRQRLKDLDRLPRPAWERFVSEPYDFTAQWLREAPVFTMNTSRGCPFPCEFCSVGSIWGKRYATMSAGRIVDDIEYVKQTYGAKGIYFREDNFTLNRERVVDFCELMISRGAGVEWMCETRIDSLDQELVALMHRAGCRAFYFGVESGSQRILDLVKKNISVEQIEDVFALCRRRGVRTYASFLAGLPTETDAEIMETVALSERIKPTSKSINIFVGIPTSPLYDYVLENRLHAYIDSVGLVYLKGHNRLVESLGGGAEALRARTENGAAGRPDSWSRASHDVDKPTAAAFFRHSAHMNLRSGRKRVARGFAVQALRAQVLSGQAWLLLIATFLHLPSLRRLRSLRHGRRDARADRGSSPPLPSVWTRPETHEESE